MCQYELAHNDDVICREGEMGDKVFMILSGNVRVTASPGNLGITHEEVAEENPSKSRTTRRGSVIKQQVRD